MTRANKRFERRYRLIAILFDMSAYLLKYLNLYWLLKTHYSGRNVIFVVVCQAFFRSQEEIKNVCRQSHNYIVTLREQFARIFEVDQSETHKMLLNSNTIPDFPRISRVKGVFIRRFLLCEQVHLI